MRKITPFIALFFIAIKSFAQIPSELTWSKTYDGTSYSTTNQYFPLEPQSCAFDTSGRLFVAGRIYNLRVAGGGWYEYLQVIKYNPLGGIIQSVNINGVPGVKNQKVNKMIVDEKTNTVYTLSTFYTNVTKKSDIHLAKYTNTLTLLWDAFVSGKDSSVDVAVDMELDSAGNVIIAGNLQNDNTGTTTGQNISINKYSKKGLFLWSYSYTGSGKNTDAVNAIKIDNNQDVIVAGRTFAPAKGDQLLVFKIAKKRTR